MTLLTDSLLYDLAALAVAAVVITITYFKWTFTYWQRVGLTTLDPQIPYGDTKDLWTGKLSFGEQFLDIYNQLKAKGVRHGGVYTGPKPSYIPLDPEIIKNILVKDFQHFVNHGGYINEEADPLSGHLFNLEDAKWRNLRVKLTPTFTSGKMKMMFQTLADCSKGLKSIMDDSAVNHTPVDIKEILGRFTTDTIGSCAFGLECNSLKDPNAAFRTYGRKVFVVETWDKIKALLTFALPHSLLRMLNVRLTKKDVETFFMKVVEDTVKYRESNNVYRKDFMHLLLQLKNRGTIADDEKLTDEDGKFQEKALTMRELSAQAFVFFAAGFETSSTTMSWALYELASNPDVQEKLRKEIKQVLAKHGDNLTYDAVMDMTYMEKVLHETLRKYPPVPFLPRQCSEAYTVPGTDIRLEKGTMVTIPTLGLHMDPQYYPDPKKFDPDRFDEENKNSRPHCTWLPFGEGPRLCIGLRFGILQSKVGLTTLLKNYQITLSKKTKLPLQSDKNSFIMAAEGGIWIDVEKLD